MITSYQENLMTLNRLIPEQYISKYILKIKDEEEKKDNLNFNEDDIVEDRNHIDYILESYLRK